MVVLPEPCLFAASPILLFRWTLYALLARLMRRSSSAWVVCTAISPCFSQWLPLCLLPPFGRLSCISFFPFFANFATLSMKPRRPSNQAMQLTAGRRTERLKDEL